MTKLFPQDNNIQPIPAPAGVHANISQNADSAPLSDRPAPAPAVAQPAPSVAVPVSDQAVVASSDSGLVVWEIGFGAVFGIAAVALYLWAKRSK